MLDILGKALTPSETQFQMCETLILVVKMQKKGHLDHIGPGPNQKPVHLDWSNLV